MSTGGSGGASASARRWVLALASVASLIVVLDALVVSTALNTIRVHLDASVEELGWTVNAYTLSFAVLLMPAAAAGDRYSSWINQAGRWLAELQRRCLERGVFCSLGECISGRLAGDG